MSGTARISTSSSIRSGTLPRPARDRGKSGEYAYLVRCVEVIPSRKPTRKYIYGEGESNET